MIILLAAAAALLLPLLRYLYRRIWTIGLDARIRFGRASVLCGEEAELTEEIINRKRFPLPQVEVGFRVQKGLRFLDGENIVISDFVYKRDVFALRGMESVTRKYHLACERRGRYQISKTILKSWSFFHDRTYETEVEDTDKLLVFASPIDVSRVMDLCLTLLGETMARRSLYEDPFAFAGIREYQPSDPLRQVNWKATAKAGELMVNTYASVTSQQFMVYLDIADLRIIKEEDLLEAGISAAASLCRKMIRAGGKIGIAVNTDPPFCLQPGRGQEQLQKIEFFLTEDFSNGRAAPFETLYEKYPPKESGSVPVMISKNTVSAQIGNSMTDKAVNRSESVSSFMPAVYVRPVRENGQIRLEVSRAGKGGRPQGGSGKEGQLHMSAGGSI